MFVSCRHRPRAPGQRSGFQRPALIQQALACEAKGQDAERKRFLELAVQADPASPVARGLLGQVKVDGQWLNPVEAAGREQSDDGRAAFRAQYEARRDATPEKAAAHVEACPLVRGARAEGRGDRPPDARHPARPVKSSGVASAGLPDCTAASG